MITPPHILYNKTLISYFLLQLQFYSLVNLSFFFLNDSNSNNQLWHLEIRTYGLALEKE